MIPKYFIKDCHIRPDNHNQMKMRKTVYIYMGLYFKPMWGFNFRFNLLYQQQKAN